MKASFHALLLLVPGIVMTIPQIRLLLFYSVLQRFPVFLGVS